jgi:hypothetical protein
VEDFGHKDGIAAVALEDLVILCCSFLHFPLGRQDPGALAGKNDTSRTLIGNITTNQKGLQMYI